MVTASHETGDQAGGHAVLGGFGSVGHGVLLEFGEGGGGDDDERQDDGRERVEDGGHGWGSSSSARMVGQG